MLEDLKSIKIDPKLTNIISKEIGKELYIENEFHKAKGFRKLHIEVAEFSKNLKIIQWDFFPDPKFDIPIFGMDLVKINDIVSAAIVDLSPASQNQGLKYEKLLSEVDKSSFTSLRELNQHLNLNTIVIFKPPKILTETGYSDGSALIKRIVGLPGDKIEVSNGKLYRNEKEINEPWIKEPIQYEMEAINVPKYSLWVLGDNRNNSLDSHIWGPLPEKNLIGTALARYWPLKQIGPIRFP